MIPVDRLRRRFRRPPNSPPRSPSPPSLRAALSWLVVGALLTFLLGSMLGPATLLTYVDSGSMSGTLETGDGFVAVPAVLAGEPGPGDVVIYRANAIDDGLVTHRIVEETPAGFVTKGDANPVTDQRAGEPLVQRDRIAAHALTVGGGVLAIPNLGTSMMWIDAAIGPYVSPTLTQGPFPVLVLAGGGAMLFFRRRAQSPSQ